MKKALREVVQPRKIETEREDRFTQWFIIPFYRLRHHCEHDKEEWNGAFIALSMGCMLCERYHRIITETSHILREKDKELPENEGHDDKFRHSAANQMKIDTGDFNDFWLIFRNGIQHQGMPRRLQHKDQNGNITREYVFRMKAGYTWWPKKKKYKEYIKYTIDPWEFTERMLLNFVCDPNALKEGFDCPLAEIYEE